MTTSQRTTDHKSRPADLVLHVLVVEDDEVDVMNMRRCVAAAKLPWLVETAGGGDEALSLLRTREARHGRAQRWLVLIDLNLPGMNGFDLLARIAADPVTAGLPVVVMTTSRDDRDVRAAFAARACGYFVKPLVREQFIAIISAIGTYWTLSEHPT